MTNKIKLGIFCPHTFNDYPFLRDLLNKKVDEIGLIISNCSGYELPEQYAKENNIPLLTYPIGKHLNALKANDLIIRASSSILVIENGDSKNNETVIKKCKGANKPYKIINATEDSFKKLYEELSAWKKDFENGKSKEEDICDWLLKHDKSKKKLIKIIEKL